MPLYKQAHACRTPPGPLLRPGGREFGSVEGPRYQVTPTPAPYLCLDLILAVACDSPHNGQKQLHVHVCYVRYESPAGMYVTS
jgi:hypothetical protein